MLLQLRWPEPPGGWRRRESRTMGIRREGCRRKRPALRSALPRIVRRPALRSVVGRSAAVPAASALVAVAVVAATAEVSAASGHLGDLGARVAQRRADLVHLHLQARAPFAVVFVIADGQPAGDDHPHPLGQGLGDVLAVFPPHGAADEHSLAVLPLLGLAVQGARSGGDGEGSYGRTRTHVTKLRITGQIPDDGDDRFACHGLSFGVDVFLRPRCAAASCGEWPRSGQADDRARRQSRA